MTALAAALVLLAVSLLFAATSACGGVLHATTRHGRALRYPASAAAAAAAVWTVCSPLAAAAVPVLFAVAATIRRRRRCGGLAEYVAACDRSRSAEPPWWPEFERQFRRECRRHAGARRPF